MALTPKLSTISRRDNVTGIQDSTIEDLESVKTIFKLEPLNINNNCATNVNTNLASPVATLTNSNMSPLHKSRPVIESTHLLSSGFNLSKSSRPKDSSYVSYNYTNEASAVNGTKNISMTSVAIPSPDLAPIFVVKNDDFFDEANDSLTKRAYDAAFEDYERRYFECNSPDIVAMIKDPETEIALADKLCLSPELRGSKRITSFLDVLQ